MQLVEEGKLDLHENVNTYLTGVEISNTYPGHPVTMYHLLTHSADFTILVLSQYVEERYGRELLEPGSESTGYLLKDRVADVAEFLAASSLSAPAGPYSIPKSSA